MQKKKTNFRWAILSLLFIATTILYIDRSALGILAPDLRYRRICNTFRNCRIGIPDRAACHSSAGAEI
ncbi:MAG: hypothetical protein AB7V25_09340 [Mangrovibacterium sp.]